MAPPEPASLLRLPPAAPPFGALMKHADMIKKHSSRNLADSRKNIFKKIILKMRLGTRQDKGSVGQPGVGEGHDINVPKLCTRSCRQPES